MAEQVNYIKVARIDGDGNDLTDTLQDLTKLTIPYSSGNVTYDILNITRYSTYFMYYVENPSVDFADRDDIEYIFTGSIVTNNLSNIGNREQIPITTNENDPLNLFDSTVQAYKINTLTQKDIYVDFSSVFIARNSPGVSGSVGIGVAIGIPGEPPGTTYNISYNPAQGFDTYDDFHISASIPQSELNNRVGQYIFPYYDLSGPLLPAAFIRFDASNPTQFALTSSIPTGSGLETIPEPYFTQNFDRAYDCQPLLNNVSRYNSNPYLQDLDYQTSQTVPVNIQAIVSGSATKGTVPQSHYTQLSSTLIRYDGSKSTSQFLNKWTPGDSGGYGKLPNIDSTQVYVAYCDSITSSIQERMDTSAAHVKYLIKDDGTVVVPDVTPNSLGTIQDNFVSQERLELNSQTVGTGGGSNSFRDIVRGGSRIEPIIYNQKSNYIEGSMSFDSSILLTDNNLVGGVIEDYQAKLGTNEVYGPSGFGTDLTTSPFYKVKFDHIKSSGSGVPQTFVTEGGFDYTVRSGLITGGSNLIFSSRIGMRVNTVNPNEWILSEGRFAIRVYNETTSQFIGGQVFSERIEINPWTGNGEFNFIIEGSLTIPSIDLIDGHIYSIRLQQFPGTPTIGEVRVLPKVWLIEQSPTPTSTVDTTDLFNKVPDAYTSSYQGIYVTASNFVSAYGTPNIQQSSSVDSGFIPITTNLEFLPGDEFRFMGREDKVFMIEKVEQDILPFTTTSASLMIYLDGRVNPDDTVLNVNQFLVRRYVDEASSIIFKGDKPLDSVGPYIVSPEFISSDLDKDVDTFITDLTERNLLP